MPGGEFSLPTSLTQLLFDGGFMDWEDAEQPLKTFTAQQLPALTRLQCLTIVPVDWWTFSDHLPALFAVVGQLPCLKGLHLVRIQWIIQSD